MDAKILQDVGLIERKQMLRDSAVRSEDFTYPKPLDAKEVTHLKDEYTKKRITISKLDEKKKEFMTDWKAEMKPLLLETGEQMTKIRSKVEEITGDVFLLAEHDEGMMGYYNTSGELVYSRPLMPEEMQFSIVDNSHKKNGTTE